MKNNKLLKTFLKESTGNLKIKVLVDKQASTLTKLRISSPGTCKWVTLETKYIVSFEELGFRLCNDNLFPYVKLEVTKNEVILKILDSLSTLVEKTKGPSTKINVPELSGAQWVPRFPDKKRLEDLHSSFYESVLRFIDALVTAGARCTVASTLRPLERAHLMHYSFKIARENMDPKTVPVFAGVNIEWWHGNLADSKAAAQAMVTGYGIVHKPALNSNHTKGKAIDMNISWETSPLIITDGNDQVKRITSTPRTGMNTDLHTVGASYGVIKLVTDPPHWSIDGH